MDDRLRKSRRQEREGMRKLGGRQTGRSGANWHSKNDGRTVETLVEYKRTDNKKQITIHYTDLRDAERNALAEGRTMEFRFELMNREYVVRTAVDDVDVGDAYGTNPVVGTEPIVDDGRQVPGRWRNPGATVLSRGRPSEFRSQRSKGDM